MLLKEWENNSSRSVYPLSKNHPLSGTARAVSEEVYLSHIEKSKSSTSGQKEDRGWEAVSLAFKDSTFGCWSAKLLQRAPPLSFGDVRQQVVLAPGGQPCPSPPASPAWGRVSRLGAVCPDWESLTMDTGRPHSWGTRVCLGDSVFTSILSSLCWSLQTSDNRKEEVTGLKVMSGLNGRETGVRVTMAGVVGRADVEQTLWVWKHGSRREEEWVSVPWLGGQGSPVSHYHPLWKLVLVCVCVCVYVYTPVYGNKPTQHAIVPAGTAVAWMSWQVWVRPLASLLRLKASFRNSQKP